MEGVYRLRTPAGELDEAFVAAPGPGGWRWFGRVHEPAGGARRWSVDVVVDLAWRLVRFRMLGPDGAGTVVTPAIDGLEVIAGDGPAVVVPEAEAVWSPSPSAVLVADRMLRADGRAEVVAAAVDGPGAPGRAEAIRIGGRERVHLATPAGPVEGERLRLTVAGRTFDVLLGPDRPLQADGWFRLAPGPA